MKLSRIALVGGVAASTVLLIAGPAAAHVSVQPVGEAAKGGYATLNFKVPNERDQASTVKVEVNFPADHPLSSVTPQAVPGWKIDITKSKLDKPLEVHGKKITEAVSKVTWTADEGEIAPATSSSSRSPSARFPRTPTSSSSRRSRRTTTRKSSAGSRSPRRAARSPTALPPS